MLTVSRDGSEHPLDGPGRLVRLRRIARWLFAAALVWATVMGASEAFAQAGTRTWVGGNGPNWSTIQNWLDGERPSRGDDLIFPASANLVTINDLVDLSVNSITIRDNYVISGFPLEITGDILMVSLQDVTASLTLDVALRKVPIRVGTEDGTLILSGVVTAQSLQKAGLGTLVLSNANNIDAVAGVANCGVIRATHADALGTGVTRASGQIELSEGCTLRLEASTTLEKPIILNGNGALGNTGVLVIAAGVTLNENVDVPAGAAATISVLSGAALFLPDGANA